MVRPFALTIGYLGRLGSLRSAWQRLRRVDTLVHASAQTLDSMGARLFRRWAEQWRRKSAQTSMPSYNIRIGVVRCGCIDSQLVC